MAPQTDVALDDVHVSSIARYSAAIVYDIYKPSGLRQYMYSSEQGPVGNQAYVDAKHAYHIIMHLGTAFMSR
jgi:hypothetical protein